MFILNWMQTESTSAQIFSLPQYCCTLFPISRCLWAVVYVHICALVYSVFFASYVLALREKRTAVVAQLKQLQSETEPIVKMFEDPETTRQMQSTRWVSASVPAALHTNLLPLVKRQRQPQLKARVSTVTQECYKRQRSTEQWKRRRGKFSTIIPCSVGSLF